MPEHIRALIVILFMSALGFGLAKYILRDEIADKEFKLWRNAWFVFTLAAFVTANFWVYAGIATIYIFFTSSKMTNKMAFFFILLFVLPPIGQAIPGFGLINYVITLEHARLLCLAILLPAALKISQNNQFRFLKVSTDKFILLYIILISLLELRDTTFTDMLRRCFYCFTDIFLPYYVASRSLKNIQQIKVVMTAFLVVGIVIALIAIFESFKGWILYRSILVVIGNGYGDRYLSRAGVVRSVASLLQPIVLGYFMAIALGFYLFLSSSIQKKSTKWLGFCILALGLYSPLSRGPWIGAALMIVTFLAFGPAAFKKIATLSFISIMLIPILTILPGGEKYLNLIPFIGETETSTISYRQDLFKNSMIVIDKYPMLGSGDYINEPEMRSLEVGGVIDIVNSYIRIALESGYVGLSLFIGAFISALFAMYGQLKRIKDKSDTHRSLLRAMIGVVLSIMVTIATVSSIGVVPTVYWSIIGLSIACSQIAKNYLKTKQNTNQT
jgi:O-Antigen ligase